MPSDIESVIRPLLATSTVVELEVRFQGFLRTSLFYNYLLAKYDFSEPAETSVVDYDNDYRTITYSDGSYDTWQKVQHHKHGDNLYTFNVSSETFILDVSEVDRGIYKSIRNRVRRTYSLFDRVDLILTKVNDTNYEVEIEIELQKEDSSDLTRLVDSFFSNFDTFYRNVVDPYYTICKEFLEHYNKSVRASTGNLDRYVLAKPRPFKIADFVTHKSDMGIDSGYTITVKGDGYSTVLAVIKGKALCIARSTEDLFRIIEPNLLGYGPFTTIYVGEETEHPTNSKKKLYTVFDILYDSRSAGVPNMKNHLDRLEIAKEYSKPFHYSTDRSTKYYYEFYFKDFHPIGKTPETMAVAYKKASKDAERYPFRNDGFILTPIYTLQNPHPKGINKKIPRFLGYQHDLCKIKPFSQQTIDFLPIIDRNGDKKLMMYGGVEFKGSSRYPFDPNINVDWDSIPQEAYGSVVEMKPIVEDDVNILTFGRYRPDKLDPNGETAAVDAWNDIGRPIADSVFLNEDYIRLFRQNNEVKRQLIDTFPDGCIVVDIGGGRGADIDKYLGKAVRVIYVEILEKNIAQLRKRLSVKTPAEQEVFSAIHTGGEDTEAILEEYLRVKRLFPEAPTVISCMLSLTFFWKSRSFLDKFLRTCGAIASFSSGTKFAFMTIEGHRFVKLFDADGQIKEKGLRAKYEKDRKGGISIPGRVTIQLTGSILSEPQVEYLVDLDDLLPDITIEWTKSSVIERYLSEKERRYGMATIYGMGTVNGNYTMSKLMRSLYKTQDVKMLREGYQERSYLSLNGTLEFENIGSNYYKIRFLDNTEDVISNFLINILKDFEKDPDGKRELFYNEFINSLREPDPRYSVKDAISLYLGKDPATVFAFVDENDTSKKLPANARIYTLSRGLFQNGFFNLPTKKRGQFNPITELNPFEIIRNQLDSDSPSPELYMMIADYLEISFQIIDGLSDITQSENIILVSWISIPKSYLTVLFVADTSLDTATTHYYAVGERGLDGKIMTMFTI